MDIIYKLFDLFFTNVELNINETLKEFSVSAYTKDMTVPKKEDIFLVLQEFSNRDVIYICVDLLETRQATLETTLDADINSFIGELEYLLKIKEHSDLLQLIIKINKIKTESQIISIYNFEDMVDYLNNLSLKGILFCFNEISKNKEYIIFEFQQNEIREFNTGKFYFLNRNTKKIVNNKKINNLEKRLTICNFLNANEYSYLPDDFYMQEESCNEKINKIFNKLNIIFSLVFLCNYSRFEKEDTVTFKIDGYKTIENIITFNDIDSEKITSKILFEIYKWIYNDGNLSDKIGLARNIIPLHLTNDKILNIEEGALASIISSHEIYLKQNIQQYIEVKNKVTEFMFDMTQKSSSLINGFLSTFKNSITLFVTFFITVIIMNNLSDKKLSNIFTKDITYISYALLGISVVLLVLSVVDVKKNIYTLKTNYTRLKSNYDDILNTKDIDRIFNFDKDHNEDIKNIESSVKLYSVIWIIILIILFVTVHCLQVK